ncbi:MAG: glycosyltransferase [Planctomycetota bacterium]|nr:glycosyltransferase [Planctomycetota bacterium]
MFFPSANSRVVPGEPLGVAHIAFSLKTGGMERLLVEFARNADRNRFRLQYFCLTERGTPAQDIEALGWPVHELNKRSGFRWSAVTQLAREFRRSRIAVVHSHNSGAMIYGALAARWGGVPAVIHTRHGQRFGAGRRQTWVFACITRLIDRVVGVSQDSAAMSIAEGVPPSRVRTIWNGIDVSRFAYTGGNPRGPAVIVARLAPEKDLETLLRAVALIAPRSPSFRLQIVGDGPCMPQVRELVERWSLAEYVQLLGERRDVPAILQAASMFVLPSRTEGVSLTLLEAMASGLPVVATQVGGNPEVVENGQTGWLVPVGDAEQMAAALQRLSADPVAAHAMGVAGRRRVETHFDVSRMVRDYEAMYSEVLDGKRP